MNKKLIMTAVVAGLISGKLAMANEHEAPKADDKAKKEHNSCKNGCNGKCSGKKKKKDAKAEAAPAPAPAPAAPADGNH